MRYDREWRARTGNRLEMHRRIRNLFVRLGDADLNNVVRLLSQLVATKRPQDIDIVDLALAIVRSDPRLLLLGRHLLR
jgi:flavin-dependent dehydrogenase